MKKQLLTIIITFVLFGVFAFTQAEASTTFDCNSTIYKTTAVSTLTIDNGDLKPYNFAIIPVSSSTTDTSKIIFPKVQNHYVQGKRVDLTFTMVQGVMYKYLVFDSTKTKLLHDLDKCRFSESMLKGDTTGTILNSHTVATLGVADVSSSTNTSTASSSTRVPATDNNTKTPAADNNTKIPAADDNTGGVKINTGIHNPLGNSISTIPDFIVKILNIVLIIAIPIIALAIIYSGFLFVTSGGNSEQLKKAKKTLLYTVIGAALILGSLIIAESIRGTVEDIGSTSK